MMYECDISICFYFAQDSARSVTYQRGYVYTFRRRTHGAGPQVAPAWS